MSKEMKHINIPVPAQVKYEAEIAAKLRASTVKDWIAEAIHLASTQVLQDMGVTSEVLANGYKAATGLKYDGEPFERLKANIKEKEVVEVGEIADPLLEEIDSEVV